MYAAGVKLVTFKQDPVLLIFILHCER